MKNHWFVDSQKQGWFNASNLGGPKRRNILYY